MSSNNKKRKGGSTSKSSSVKSVQAKIPKSTFSLEAMLEEIGKLERPEDIEKKALQLRDDLVKEWKRGKDQDVKLVDAYLETAKVLLTKLEYMPLTHNPQSSGNDLRIARDILEIGVMYSVRKAIKGSSSTVVEGMKDFERYISQLKHYYFDMRNYFRGASATSAQMYEILGMNLLYLLCQDRISEFHTELELFIHPNVDEVMANPYIKKAVEIEQFIAEGQYNKIYELKKIDLQQSGISSPGFKYFIEYLENMLKEDPAAIASVLGAAYDKLPLHTAMQMLNLNGTDDSPKMGNIIKSQKWSVEEGYIYFHAKKDTSDAIPAEELLRNALVYSNELDIIV